ncbi:hypothetical protein HELRODRAFT_115304 [Helobdella robusta]|uniref:F-box domain-containing protein n=1 Tax=Helobdella robusta TaxID=6412 RepID=T1EG74_HELRO|nr:hypothetical protein HELRODRAFT_115304 [Helobdella robusta]ESN93804.1 hypothetical protein HELRODRAFT_115304 [Helobdella robusta]
MGPFKPKFAIRPPLCQAPPKSFLTSDGLAKHKIKMNTWLHVFSYLSHEELTRCCMLVCKTWYKWCLYSPLWKKMDFKRRKIKQVDVDSIARHQPECLDLSHTNISRQQLTWLAGRLFNLRSLKLTACAWSAVSCLNNNGSFCPQLRELDLSWVSGCSDLLLKGLLSASVDERPGVDASLLRLRNCVKLVLTGSDITDASVELIGQTLLKLVELDVSYCQGVTSKSIQFLSNSAAYSSTTTSSSPSPSVPKQNSSTNSKNQLQHPQQQQPPNKQLNNRSHYKPTQPQTAHRALAHDCTTTSASTTTPASSNWQLQQPPTNNISEQLTTPHRTSPSLFPLPDLKSLILVGCHSIDVTSLNDVRNLRPDLKIIIKNA